MTTSIRNSLLAAAVISLLTWGNALAAEPTNFDYTGLPVTDTSLEGAVGYTTIPVSLTTQGCEVVENQDDYTGADMTRCITGEGEPELEWSYLY